MGASGQATLDFGAFPGASDASIAVTGQAGIVSGSMVEAWIFPATTADHSPDEHLVETLTVRAGNIVGGTGFTIYGYNTSQLAEPGEQQWASTRVAGPAGPLRPVFGGGQGTRIWGTWNIGWVWV